MLHFYPLLEQFQEKDGTVFERNRQSGFIFKGGFHNPLSYNYFQRQARRILPEQSVGKAKFCILPKVNRITLADEIALLRRVYILYPLVVKGVANHLFQPIIVQHSGHMHDSRLTSQFGKVHHLPPGTIICTAGPMVEYIYRFNQCCHAYSSHTDRTSTYSNMLHGLA